MTNPTTHGQVPAIQRYSIGYHSDEGGVRSLSPTSIYDDEGPWVRYEDHAAELRRLHAYCQELEAQVILECMTHVQNSVENKHVAGDVSKNGAELNMSTQQPAPATQPAPQQEAQEPAFWTVCAQYEDGDKTGWIPLPWYSNETQLGVMDLVLKAVRREGYKGMASERLQELGWEIRPVYLAPQPSLQQPVAVPLTDEQIEALPLWKRFVGLWPETRREIVRTIEHHHGIKGGQHGTE